MYAASPIAGAPARGLEAGSSEAHCVGEPLAVVGPPVPAAVVNELSRTLRR